MVLSVVTRPIPHKVLLYVYSLVVNILAIGLGRKLAKRRIHYSKLSFLQVKRVKNHWTLHLKDGIMHLNGKDHAFSVANGTADW